MLPGRGLIARIRGRRGRIRRDSCQLGPRAAAVQGRDARVYGAARRVTALGRATQRVAASAERARRAAALAGAAMVGTAGAAMVGAAVQGRRWWARWCGGTALVGAARGGANGRGAAAGAAMVTALGLTAQQARWKRVTVGREESGLARRNTPVRMAVIRLNWQALPRRALRALR